MPRPAEPAGVADMSASFDYDENTMPLLWKPHRPVRPEKSEGGRKFKLVSAYDPGRPADRDRGNWSSGIDAGERDQVLLGVTGSGKTFTMARSSRRPSARR
jgi:excinuclease ABC subunit B